ncbi:MAG: hypothetical protein LBI28_09985 [Treponema sp.]|jgi:hypothetical protein|nr:hypothetical protein [Treponema sp.]
MIRTLFLSIFMLFAVFASLFAQGGVLENQTYVIRGEVYVDLEPMYAGHVDTEYPLDVPMAGRRALEELSMFFSAMIYGWSFNYEVGERARRIEENLVLEPIATIRYGDPALRVTDTEVIDNRLRVWADYHLNDTAQRRIHVWRTGMIRNAQATGYGPSYVEEYPGWIALKRIALEDAAREALRAMLRGSERNRPKEVTGFISLAEFPRYYISSGRWAAFARFRVQITEIIPYSVY